MPYAPCGRLTPVTRDGSAGSERAGADQITPPAAASAGSTLDALADSGGAIIEVVFEDIRDIRETLYKMVLGDQVLVIPDKRALE